MSSPSDGGKGSARRKEDSQAVRDNWDRIFGRKDKPMEDEHEDDVSDEWACEVCGGPMYRQPHWGYAQCDDCGHKEDLIDDDYT